MGFLYLSAKAGKGPSGRGVEGIGGKRAPHGARCFGNRSRGGSAGDRARRRRGRIAPDSRLGARSSPHVRGRFRSGLAFRLRSRTGGEGRRAPPLDGQARPPSLGGASALDSGCRGDRNCERRRLEASDQRHGSDEPGEPPCAPPFHRRKTAHAHADAYTDTDITTKRGRWHWIWSYAADDSADSRRDGRERPGKPVVEWASAGASEASEPRPARPNPQGAEPAPVVEWAGARASEASEPRPAGPNP